MNQSTDPKKIRQEILRLTREYSSITHAAQRPGDDSIRSPFVAGDTLVPYAGRVFTEDEVEAAVSATLDFWLTLGPEGEAFEHELASFLGVKHTLLVNSGSSANLLSHYGGADPSKWAGSRVHRQWPCHRKCASGATRDGIPGW